MPVDSILLPSGNSRPDNPPSASGLQPSRWNCRHAIEVATDSDTLSRSNGRSPDDLSDDSLRAQVQELQDEVLAKDELVQALTVQLEQLAEQLDRLHRSGADRKRAGGLPGEVVESHKKIVGDLERVVQQWEDMQAGMMLGRIEVQLSELRDFISDRLSGAPALPRSGGPAFPALPTSVVMERISVMSAPAEPPVIETSQSEAHESKSPELSSMWESLKSKMLDDGPKDEEDSAASVNCEEPPAPSPINPSTATPEELETAIDERDAYITFLLRKGRQQSAVPAPPDWVSLEGVPEELCRTLESQKKQLEELSRTAEIELSLERARIGREQSRLRSQQEAIEKQMRRLGLKTIDEQVAETEEVSATDRRWVRFLGLPRGKQ